MKSDAFLPLAGACALLVAAGSATAQSEVTLYGRVNVTAERQQTPGRTLKVLQNNASRIGFTGVEDLGGGLKAGFGLESGFNVDTGTQTSTAFFGRRSEVYLSSNTLGRIRFGTFFPESYYATADFVSLHNHDTGTSADALYTFGRTFRTNNKIAYRTPQFVPNLTLEVSASAGEGAASTAYSNGRLPRAYDFAANYGVGPVQLGAGYSKAGEAWQGAVRALVTVGPATFGAYVQRDRGDYLPAGNTGTRNNFRLSAMYVLGASEFHLNGGRTGSYSTIDQSSAKQYTVAYNYNLSKRTKVYAFYTKIDADTNTFRLVNGAGYAGDFSSLAVGLRHNF